MMEIIDRQDKKRDLSNVLVTGGSRGIGRAIAIRLARPGMNLAITYHDKSDAAEETARQVREQGAVCHIFPCALEDVSSVVRLPAIVATTLGGVDFLINNVGIVKDSLFSIQPEDDWGAVLKVNLWNTLRLTLSALPYLVNGGCIITVSSLAGRSGKEGQVAYSATKAALFGMNRLLVRNYASRGLTSFIIAPGFIQTDMIAALPSRVYQQTLRGSAMNRLGEAGEIAEWCALLASNRGGYMNGTLFPMDGGFRV